MDGEQKSSRMAASIKFVMVFVYGLAAHSTASTIRVTKASASCMCRKVCVCVCVLGHVITAKISRSTVCQRERGVQKGRGKYYVSEAMPLTRGYTSQP